MAFQPDLVWIKTRNEAENHFLVDSVRGVTKQVYVNLNASESTNANRFKSFNPKGDPANDCLDTAIITQPKFRKKKDIKKLKHIAGRVLNKK